MSITLDDKMPAAAMTIGQMRTMMFEVAVEAQVAASRKAAASIDRISAARAAVIAKRRRATVLAACESGALPAKRSGIRWSIAIRDLDAWCSAGCPEHA